MKQQPMALNEVKGKIKLMKGKEFNFEVNIGRKKMIYFAGIIDSVYPSVFTVRGKDENKNLYTYSYNDILCGFVKITEL